MSLRRPGRYLVVLFASCLATPVVGQTMYGTSTVAAPLDALLTIDLATAATAWVDPTQTYDVLNTGVAISCDGRFFGFNLLTPQTGELYEADLASGTIMSFQTFVVAAAAPPFTSGIGFSFAADGQPYVVNDSRLYRLDTRTSEALFVGATGYTGHANLTLGLDCTLQAAAEAAGSWDFIRLDEQTAAATVLGVNAPASMISIEPANGRLYGSQIVNLLELDPATGGLLVAIGSMGLSVPGMAFDVPSTCINRPVATITPPPAICLGELSQLDGATSSACGITGLEYRWRQGANVLCDWSTISFCDVVPAITTDYSLDVRCANAPGMCPSSDDTQIVVVTPPTAAAGPDLNVCELWPITLDGSGSTAAWCTDVVYEWWDGASLLKGPSPDPTFAPSTTSVGTTTYTLVVRCTGPAACEDTDDVVVTVRACPLEVVFESVTARRLDRASGRIAVTWSTAMEEGTLGFIVERASSSAGPWRPIGDALARGAGSPYAIEDALAAPGSAWYRIVEVTAVGRGTVSPAVQAAAPSGGSRRRRAVRER